MHSLWIPTETNRGTGAAAAFLIGMAAGVVPVTNDAAGLTAAIAAAAGGGGVVELVAPVVIGGNVTLTAGVSLISRNASSVSGSGRIVCDGAGSLICGIDFQGSSGAITLRSTSGISGLRVWGNRFACAAQIAIQDQSTSDNSLHSNLDIQHNLFDGHGYALLGIRQDGLVFRYNECRNTTSRNVEVRGAKNSHIEDNWIDGGVTCVAILMDGQFGRFCSTNSNNSISRNTLLNWTEEAISTDVHGNLAANVSTRDLVTVTGKSGSAGSSPRINFARTAQLDASGYSAMWVTGANAGLQAPLNFQGVISAGVSYYVQLVNNSITAAQYTDITNGDVVAIGHAFVDSRIVGNVLWSDKPIADGIVLWGNCFRTKITGNIVRVNADQEAITAIALAGLVAPSTAAAAISTSINCCPVARNLIANNVIESGLLCTRGKSYNTPANSYATQYTNTVDNNICTPSSQARESWKDVGGVDFFGPSSSAFGLNNIALTGANEDYRPTTGSPLLTGGTDLGYIRDRDGRQSRRYIGAYGAAALRSET